MIGSRLKKARELKGLSQRQMAERLNVTMQSVSNWEADNQSISLEHIESCARILGCSMDYLCGLSNNMFIQYEIGKETLLLDDIPERIKGALIRIADESRKKE